ncbi:hypothetical protein V1512DRAFT_246419 [Lipomyces arxii]|uniref:uncharacterized protein n=1 Tax=Lipomyces arxii TaxID=56418 RepID=UPI0034CD7C6F
MNYLLHRSLDSTKYNHRRFRRQAQFQKKKLNKSRLHDIDPQRKLVDLVVLGCTANHPFKLITVRLPRLKDEPTDLAFSLLSDDSNTDETHVPIGSVLLWTLNRAYCIDYSVAPTVSYNKPCQFARIPVLSIFSAWDMASDKLLQVLLRCEEIKPRAASWACDDEPKHTTAAYDCELVEFRSAGGYAVVCAGTGEFDGNHSVACFALYDQLGLIAVALNSRIFLYGMHASPEVKMKSYWHLLPDSELQLQQDDAILAVVELDFFVTDMYPRHFVFSGESTDKSAISFDEFAIRSLRPAQNGYTVTLGALDRSSCVFVVCALALNVAETDIAVLKVFQSHVSKFRSVNGQFNVQTMLDAALRSPKLQQEKSPVRTQPNIKLLETYTKNMTTMTAIELDELDLVLTSS